MVDSKKRKFEEFEDTNLDNGFSRKVKSLMEDKYLTCHPLSSPFIANMLCPSLCILTLHVEKPSKYSVSDIGFVVESKDDITTIWGASLFLYESQSPPNSLSNLKTGKLRVTIQSLEFCQKTFDGIVTHIDFNLDILVLKIKTPQSPNIPVASLGVFSKLNHSKDKCIWIDLYSCGQRYERESYTIADPNDDGTGACGNHLHVNLNTMFVPGVLFNRDLEVVGMKMRICNINNQFAHVLRIEDIARSLDRHTHGSDFTDLLAPETKDGVVPPSSSTSGGDPVVEELQRNIEEANSRLEAAERRNMESERENAELRAQVQSLQSFQARMESFMAQMAPPPPPAPAPLLE